MKTILILLLSAALGAAAFLTRPSSDAAQAFVKQQERKQSLLERMLHHKQYAVRDRVLWVDVECDGKIVYTGAFSHFFPRTETK